MKLENQVVSLDLAKKLKELGVKQESFVKWHVPDKNSEFYLGEEPKLYTRENWEDFADENPHVPDGDFVPAYTVAELGKMLPWKLRKKNNFYEIEFHGDNLSNGKFGCAYYSETADSIPSIPLCLNADTEADARAKMLIYLLENKLIKLDK